MTIDYLLHDGGSQNGWPGGLLSRTLPVTTLASGMTLLLVDDQPEDVRFLSEMLRQAGARVIFATNGFDALRLARELLPSLILLDVLLSPPENGFDVCRELQRHSETMDIPVLFLSGVTNSESKLEGFAAGGRDYISKPYLAAEVLARVNLHVDLSRRLSPIETRNGVASAAPLWLGAAVSLLQTQLAVTPKLTDLAHQVGTNPRSLNEAFRTHLGNTVFGYLREYRMKEAHRLIMESRLTIQQIARRVGFKQPTNFASAFRERFGVSPRELRCEPHDEQAD